MEIELRLRQILESPSAVSDKLNVLIKEAQKSSTEPETFFIYLRFFYNSGFQQELLSLLAGALESRQKIPWDLLIETLGRSSLSLSKSAKLSIEKGLRRQEAERMVWGTTALDREFPEFEDFRISLTESFKALGDERKNELLEKFEFLKNQRLEEDAFRILRILKSTYPEDTQIKKLAASFEDYRAREVLNDFSHSIEETKTHVPRFTPEEIQFLKGLKEEAKKKLVKEKSYRLDVSLFFFFIDDYESALEILDLEKNLNLSELWLKAELLRYARRFLEALDLAQIISQLRQGDPETMIASVYFRAEVFGDMGQYSKAIELLENIASVRPQYRSATHLLQAFKHKGRHK